MDVTALVRIDSPQGFSTAPRPALRALVKAARRVRSLSGFRRWQTFKTLDAPDALFVLVDWENRATLLTATADEELRHWADRASAHGFSVAEPQCLPGSFDRRLSGSDGNATLLRLSQHQEPLESARARDRDYALRALAAPGTTRLSGCQSDDGRCAVCRIDFDTEDGIWHFLESPLRRAWTARDSHATNEELWALNLPDLEYHREGPKSLISAHPLRRHSSLSIQVETGGDGRAVRLQFQGRIDAAGSMRGEKICRALIARGYRRLVVDVSGLLVVSPEGLAMLTRTARYLKERNGEFVLIDNEERVRRVTRSKHLASSVR